MRRRRFATIKLLIKNVGWQGCHNMSRDIRSLVEASPLSPLGGWSLPLEYSICSLKVSRCDQSKPIPLDGKI